MIALSFASLVSVRFPLFSIFILLLHSLSLRPLCFYYFFISFFSLTIVLDIEALVFASFDIFQWNLL